MVSLECRIVLATSAIVFGVLSLYNVITSNLPGLIILAFVSTITLGICLVLRLCLTGPLGERS